MSKTKKDDFDEQYIVRFQKGDNAAFDKIFEHYKSHIYWVGLSFFSNEEMAKDLVQSVFLIVYQKIKSLKDPEKFYAWLNQIAYTQCLQMIRYNKKDSLFYINDLGENYVDENIVDEKKDAVVDALQKEEIKQIIIDEIEALSPKYRTVCYLRLFEELSWPEISKITKISEGTLSAYMSRLRPILKKALTKHGFTSTSCLSLIMLPNLTTYFKAFLDLKNPLLPSDASVILEKVHNKSNKGKINQAVWQIPAYTLIGVSLMLPISISQFQKENPFDFIANEAQETATISNITHPQQLTNQSYTINIETSNDNYDEILLNDTTNLTINHNGEYKICLIKNEKEIDTQSITITNIDKDIPMVTNQLFKDGIMTLYLNDEDSQIDFENIEFYENGTMTNDFSLNIDKKEIYIFQKVDSNNILKVPDIAGNVMNVSVIFYKIPIYD